MGKNIAQRKREEAQFFEDVFRDILDEEKDLRLVLQTLPNNLPFGFESTLAAGDKARDLRDDWDVYFQMALMPSGSVSTQERRRGKESDVAGLAGFSLDVDTNHDGRKKKNLFENRDEALKYIQKLEPTPTYVIQSGAGYHCHWVFHEPWIFESDGDREYARRMSYGWQLHCRSKTDRSLDPTYQLNRIWRVPGSYNHKYDPAVLVEIHHNNSMLRYEAADAFGMHAVDVAMMRKPVDGRIMKVSPDYSGNLPDNVLRALRADYEFCKIWHQKLQRIKDPSQSGYDWKVGTYGLENDWTQDEILQAMVCHRQMHSIEMKHATYWNLTMSNIMGDTVEVEIEPGAATAIQMLGTVTGIPIRAISKVGNESDVDQTVFYLHLKDDKRSRKVGIIDKMMSKPHWRKLKAMYSPSTESQLATIKPAKWAVLIDSVFPFVVDQYDSLDQDDARFYYRLDAYTQGAPDVSGQSQQDHSALTASQVPFKKDGEIFFSKAIFKAWCVDQKQPYASGELEITLKELGMKAKGINVYANKSKKPTTKYSFYTINETYLLDRISKLIGADEDDETLQ